MAGARGLPCESSKIFATRSDLLDASIDTGKEIGRRPDALSVVVRVVKVGGFDGRAVLCFSAIHSELVPRRSNLQKKRSSGVSLGGRVFGGESQKLKDTERMQRPADTNWEGRGTEREEQGEKKKDRGRVPCVQLSVKDGMGM